MGVFVIRDAAACEIPPGFFPAVVMSREFDPTAIFSHHQFYVMKSKSKLLHYGLYGEGFRQMKVRQQLIGNDRKRK